ncbi:spore coat protein, partial [Clostridium sp.]|uniref:spore coat protein n=1 Tax=Clostridium sp. TaxID=1506 RepID=UPI003464D9F4
MQEKDMINDYLSMINSSLTGYGGIISQTENQELRQTIQQMRNQDELRQYNLYQKAKEKGYYKPAQQATQTEIS